MGIVMGIVAKVGVALWVIVGCGVRLGDIDGVGNIVAVTNVGSGVRTSSSEPSLALAQSMPATARGMTIPPAIAALLGRDFFFLFFISPLKRLSYG